MIDDLPVDGLDRAVEMVSDMVMVDRTNQLIMKTPVLIVKRANRKADERRLIATYTRAFLKASGVPLPRRSNKKTREESATSNNDAFLFWAYGSILSKESEWYVSADHEAFFRYLIRRATNVQSDHSIKIKHFFQKSGFCKSAPWMFFEGVVDKKTVTAVDLRTAAEEMRGAPYERHDLSELDGRDEDVYEEKDEINRMYSDSYVKM